jgi:hypothetical protein
VLTVLIGIAMPRMKGLMDNAKIVQVQKEMQTVVAAVESYYIFSPNVYPPTSTSVQNTYLLNAFPRILTQRFYDPFRTTSNTEYKFNLSSNGKYYAVISAGIDGALGTVIVDSNNGGVVSLFGTDDICVTNGKGCGTDKRYCQANSNCQSGYCSSTGYLSYCTSGETGVYCNIGSGCQSGSCVGNACT